MDDQTVDRTRERISAGPQETGRRDEERPQPRNPSRRRLGFTAAGIVAIAIIAGGMVYWLNARHYVTTDDAFIDGFTTQMAPEVAGRVTGLLFSDNEHVSTGQTLLLIDPRDYQVKLEQAKAQQANAQAQLEQARAQEVLQKANLDQAEANVHVAEADVFQAQQDYDRYHALDPRAVTRQQIDNSTAALRSAKAKLEASQQAVSGAEAQVKAAHAQVLAVQANAAQAAANVDAAVLQLSYCTIKAPVAGTIGHRTVDVGNYVNPGQALFAIVQDNVWVTANFKETQLAAIHPGQPVLISVDAVPSVTFNGRVDSFQPGTGSSFSVLPAENATGNYVKIVQRLPVRITFDDPRVKDYRLYPGMSVEPEVKVR